MSFIVSKKADIIRLRSLEDEARKLGAPYGMTLQEVPLTLFTDDPSWESRQVLEVIASASATPDGLVLDLVHPITASLALQYVPQGKRCQVRYIVDVVEEPDQGHYEDSVIDEDLPEVEIDEDDRGTAEHLLDYFRPVTQQRETVAA